MNVHMPQPPANLPARGIQFCGCFLEFALQTFLLDSAVAQARRGVVKLILDLAELRIHLVDVAQSGVGLNLRLYKLLANFLLLCAESLQIAVELLCRF